MYVLPYGQMSLWGLNKSLKCLYNKLKILEKELYIYFIQPLFSNKVNKYKGWQRIGPHNSDIICIIFGSLLGDAHAEKREKGVGTRISFYQESSHVEYILWLHNLISSKGYTNKIIPVPTKRLGVKGKLRKVVRFYTWTYTSFNWIYETWYYKGVKRVPDCIGNYLTPLALAIWIMDDGTKVGTRLKLCTNGFTYSECLLLVKVLNDKFSLKTTIQLVGSKYIDQYVIYIRTESIPLLREIVNPYIIPGMKYKIK